MVWKKTANLSVSQAATSSKRLTRAASVKNRPNIAPTRSSTPVVGKPLVLYSSKPAVGQKRGVLEVYDASNDMDNLSSRLVKRCAWTANVPASILKKPMAGPNKACCALRDALSSGNSCFGKAAGVNCKVALCVNETGPAVLLKTVLDKGELRNYL